MQHASRERTICEKCHTSPIEDAEGYLHCKCPDVQWRWPNPLPAKDPEIAALLKQKGYTLAGCGWYYYGVDGTLLTIYNDGTWRLEGDEVAITDLKEYLLSLPDVIRL